MLDITYLDAAGREKVASFESYNEFVRSQQACWHEIPDHFKALKVTFKGRDLGYTGPYGDIYRFLLKEELQDEG